MSAEADQAFDPEDAALAAQIVEKARHAVPREAFVESLAASVAATPMHEKTTALHTVSHFFKSYFGAHTHTAQAVGGADADEALRGSFETEGEVAPQRRRVDVAGAVGVGEATTGRVLSRGAALALASALGLIVLTVGVLILPTIGRPIAPGMDGAGQSARLSQPVIATVVPSSPGMMIGGPGEYVLSTTLPALSAVLERVPLHFQEQLTNIAPEQVRELAQRFGLQGQVFTTTTQSENIPSGAKFTSYVVIDGSRRLDVTPEYIWYLDTSTGAPYRGDMAGEMQPAIPFEEARRVAEDFLTSRGLIYSGYRVEPDANGRNGVVRFVQLLNDVPVWTPHGNFGIEVGVLMSGTGSVVGAVTVPRATFEPLNEHATIVDSGAAFEMLKTGRGFLVGRGGSGNVMLLPPPDRAWFPHYRPGQWAYIEGLPRTLAPVADTIIQSPIQPHVEINRVRMEPRADATPLPMDQPSWVSGVMRQEAGGNWVMEVEERKRSPLDAYTFLSGTVTISGPSATGEPLALLHVADGRTFYLPNAPDDLPTGVAVSGLGREVERMAEGHPVFAWQMLQSPPLPSPSVPARTEHTVTRSEGGWMSQSVVMQREMAVMPAPTRASAEAVEQTYEVQAGDTLLEIAKRYGVSMEALMVSNNISGQPLIEIGQVLKIPPTNLPTASEAPPSSAPFPTATPFAAQLPITPQSAPGPIGSRVEGLEGWLNATLFQTEQGQATRVQASLAERPLTHPGWEVAIRGPLPLLTELAQHDGTRVRLWGLMSAGPFNSPEIEVERYEKVDPNERVQAWLGKLVSTTLEGRTVVVLETKEGQRFVIADTVRFGLGPSWPGLNVPEALTIQEGVMMRETFGGLPVIQNLTTASGANIEEQFKTHKVNRPTVIREMAPESKAFVEQAELVYLLNTPQKIVQPDGSASIPDQSPLVLKPAWRFAGTNEAGGTFETFIEARRPREAQVVLDVYSGRPNPSWPLDERQLDFLTNEINHLLITQTAPMLEEGLGYRGLMITVNGAGGEPRVWRIGNGYVQEGVEQTQIVRIDEAARIERLVLRTGKSVLERATFDEVVRVINARLPEQWMDVAALSSLRADQPFELKRDGKTWTYMVLMDGQPVAFGAHDPRRGCIMVWHDERKSFVDPCHGSTYDIRGRYRAGPSLSDLNRYPVRVNGDRVEVDTAHLIEGEFQRGTTALTAMPAMAPIAIEVPVTPEQ